MEILSINADQKLVSIASSIGRNPLSWDGWYCLSIHFQHIDTDLYQECLLWTRSIVESYLKDIEGRVYFCDKMTIHILCKAGGRRILDQTGTQICDLIAQESDVSPYYVIYDLSKDGYSYAQTVLKQAGNIFSLPNSVDVASTLPAYFEPEVLQNNTEDIGHHTKVLLIEDDPVTRWMVRNALKYECDFATAPSANKAYGLYASYQPDIVFLDINLPDGNGYSVLEWIIRNDPGACVVMFSSNDNLDNISSALDDGARGFVAKPFLKESLLYYIRNHTGAK